MSRNQLDEGLFEFTKTIFTSFDEIIAENNHILMYYELINIGYDGTFQSIVNNDYFWNILSYFFIRYQFIFTKMTRMDLTILEKIAKSIDNLEIICRRDNLTYIIHSAHHYLVSNWSRKYKDEIQHWAKNEYGFMPK